MVRSQLFQHVLSAWGYNVCKQASQLRCSCVRHGLSDETWNS